MYLSGFNKGLTSLDSTKQTAMKGLVLYTINIKTILKNSVFFVIMTGLPTWFCHITGSIGVMGGDERGRMKGWVGVGELRPEREAW